jgi:hypothetical protein
MIRRFQFEGEIFDSLSCLPMAARRKLDRIGIKLSRAQWERLGRGERLMICHAPAQSGEECEALRLFIEEAMALRCGSGPTELPPQARLNADPPSIPPAELITNAKTVGATLTQAAWDSLDEDQRYALVKLGGGAKVSHQLKAALAEFLKRDPGERVNS